MKNRMLLVTVLTVAVLASGIGVAYTDHLNRQLFVRMQTARLSATLWRSNGNCCNWNRAPW